MNKKIAIMQPYFMPYLGYFQLVHSVDKFLFFDDVNYIKRGWINRNKILSNNEEFMFSVPLKKVSQNKYINEIYLSDDKYWIKKFLKTIEYSYHNQKNFKEVYPLIEEMVFYETDKISELAANSVIRISEHLGLKREFSKTSLLPNIDREQKGSHKILDICKKEDASAYVNAIGGIRLYDKEDFNNYNINLGFIKTKPIEYEWWSLSMVHLLMVFDKDELHRMLNAYEII